MWWSDTSVTNLLGYTLLRKDRENGRGSGVCKYIRDHIKSYEIIEKNLNNPDLQHVWCILEVELEKILCGCI